VPRFHHCHAEILASGSGNDYKWDVEFGIQDLGYTASAGANGNRAKEQLTPAKSRPKGWLTFDRSATMRAEKQTIFVLA
jgi:hypothetical protein